MRHVYRIWLGDAPEPADNWGEVTGRETFTFRAVKKH